MLPVRGIRFEGAGLAYQLGPDTMAGLALSPTGRVRMVEDNDAVLQSIMLLLTTVPGERVMRPDYGCPLHRLIFAPNDATTAGLAIHYVRQALRRWEPRAEIVRLDASADTEEPARLVIALAYRVRSTGTEQQLEFAVQLDGGAS